MRFGARLQASAIALAGIVAFFGFILRISVRRFPLIDGMFTSMRIMSGGVAIIACPNSPQLLVVRTVQPSFSSRARPSLSTSGLSSRRRTL